MSLDVFNQCYKLAVALRSGHGRIPVFSHEMLTHQIHVNITSADYEALCAALPTWALHAGVEPDYYSVHILGVQFRRSDASWIAQLRLSVRELQVENAHLRGLLYRENHSAVDTPKPAGRRALDCDHAAPGAEAGPDTNGGRSA